MKIKNKEQILKFRVTEDEKQIVEDKAITLGFSTTSQYLRSVSIDNKIKPKADLELIFQIKKIGVNINQIAKRYNEKKNSNSMDDYLKSLDLYMKELRDFIDYIQTKDDSQY